MSELVHIESRRSFGLRIGQSAPQAERRTQETKRLERIDTTTADEPSGNARQNPATGWPIPSRVKNAFVRRLTRYKPRGSVARYSAAFSSASVSFRKVPTPLSTPARYLIFVGLL